MNSTFTTALAGILSGLFGAMGLGGGGVLIIYLTVFSDMNQAKAQGINIMFFIPIALIAILMYAKKKLIHWKIIVPYSALGILGAIIGAAMSNSIDSRLLSKIFGVLLLIMGVNQIFFRRKE